VAEINCWGELSYLMVKIRWGMCVLVEGSTDVTVMLEYEP